MRRLSLLLCALLIGAGGSFIASIPHALPVHALNTACNVASDSDEVVYEDWHDHVYAFVNDSFIDGNPSHFIGLDLWSWRESHRPVGQGLDHCYRAYYASAWTDDGSGGYFSPYMRVWICGHGSYDFSPGTSWGSRKDIVTNVPWGDNAAGYGLGNLLENVNVPGGQSPRGMYFADYGTILDGCLPQASTQGFEASSITWTPSILHSSSTEPQGWYCHDTVRGGAPGIYCG